MPLISRSLLQQLDAQTQTRHYSLLATAGDDNEFLKHGCAVRVQNLTNKQVKELLATVHKLLSTIQLDRPSKLQDHIPHGQRGLQSYGTTFIANLEHILLCLMTNLVAALISLGWVLVQKCLQQCQKERAIRTKDWFSVFPSAQRPLSTTWPWSIRPSLAVLWGVCWMFYCQFFAIDEDGNMVEDLEQIVQTNSELQAYWDTELGQ